MSLWSEGGSGSSGQPPITNRGVKVSARGARAFWCFKPIVNRGLTLLAVRPPECGFDYLTMTWRDEIRNTALGSTRNVVSWAERRPLNIGGKDFTKAWAWQGYTGWQVGQVCVGERPDGSIVRLTGKAAHDWASDGLPTGHNISRLDIALTVWGVSDQSRQIALHSVSADQYRKSLQSRPFDVRLIDGFGKGDTLYVGSRTSEQFVRVYDKERAPNGGTEYKTALRYECECKEQLAHRAYSRCVGDGYSAASCLSVLAGLLARRGIDALSTRGVQQSHIGVTELPVSSLESSLSWLEVQVKPTVSRLMREGYELEVLTALGLQRYFNNGD